MFETPVESWFIPASERIPTGAIVGTVGTARQQYGREKWERSRGKLANESQVASD